MELKKLAEWKIHVSDTAKSIGLAALVLGGAATLAVNGTELLNRYAPGAIEALQEYGNRTHSSNVNEAASQGTPYWMLNKENLRRKLSENESFLYGNK